MLSCGSRSRRAERTRSGCISRPSTCRSPGTRSTAGPAISGSSGSSCTPRGSHSTIRPRPRQWTSRRRCRKTWNPLWRAPARLFSHPSPTTRRIQPRARVPASVAGAPTSPAGAAQIQTEKESVMAVASMRELLEAGVHFGHQTRRWNPKMRRFIFTERSGIYIIDLTQTSERLDEAAQFVRNLAERNGTVLFVGTKKQAQDAVENEAKRVNMPYVNHRWLGGLLTNWRTMSDRIERLHEMRRLRDEGQMDLLPAKERISMAGELEKLEANLGGVADMRKQPDAVFIIDLKKEQLAVREARRLNLPVIALVDTNCDPDEADFVVPGNDDAIRACALITRVIANAIAEGQQKVSVKDFQKQQEKGPTPAAKAESEAEQEMFTPETFEVAAAEVVPHEEQTEVEQ